MSEIKGQKCHRGACLNTTRRVAWWNTMTRQLYCQSCAFTINDYAKRDGMEPFLFRVRDACGPEDGCKGTGEVPDEAVQGQTAYCDCWTGKHLQMKDLS